MPLYIIIVVRAAKAGTIIADKRPVKASAKLKPNTIIHYRDAELPKLTVEPEDLNLVILYEDNDLLVVNKPAVT
jgi:23S rRNA pseudouridine1911/1915/1917 synthase